MLKRQVLCKTCGVAFETARLLQKFCSRKCLTTDRNSQFKSLQQYPGIPPGTVGAIGELVVAADLLQRGYEVFRSLSPSASCDLAILKDGQLLRIEVRTGYQSAEKKLIVSNKNHRADVLAVNTNAGIIYIPTLEKGLPRWSAEMPNSLKLAI